MFVLALAASTSNMFVSISKMFVLALAAILFYINICFYSSHDHVFIFHNTLKANMSLDIPCISTKSCGIDVAEYSVK